MPLKLLISISGERLLPNIIISSLPSTAATAAAAAVQPILNLQGKCCDDSGRPLPYHLQTVILQRCVMLHKLRLLTCTYTERLPCDHRARCCISRFPPFLSFIIPLFFSNKSFTMFLLPLAVGPICTAVVLACAYLRWSQTTPLELWTMCRRLTSPASVTCKPQDSAQPQTHCTPIDQE